MEPFLKLNRDPICSLQFTEFHGNIINNSVLSANI